MRIDTLSAVGSMVLSAILPCLVPSPADAGPTWARVAIVDEDYNELFAVQPTRDGGYVAAGGHDTALHHTRGMVIKMDGDGALQWISSVGGGPGRFLSLTETADGGYVLGSEDSSVVRMSSAGDVLWHRKYPTRIGVEPVHSVVQTTDGGFLAATTDVSWTDPAVYILKLDSLGRITWQWKYEGIGIWSRIPILLHQSGGCVIAGSAKDGDALILLRLNTTGQILWQKRYDLPGGLCDPQDLRLTRDGGFILAANIAESAYDATTTWVSKLDPNGVILWERTYGSWDGTAGRTDFPGVTSIVEGAEGGYLIAGYLYTSGQAWAARLDEDGDYLWQNKYGEPVGGWIRAAGAAVDGGWMVGGYRDSPEYSRRYAMLMRLAADGSIGTACRPRITRTHFPVGDSTTITEQANVRRKTCSITATDGQVNIARPVPIIGGACSTPDLTVRWSEIDATESTIFALCNITNIGAVQSRACKLWTYLSDDAVLSPDDPQIGVNRVGWLLFGGMFGVAIVYAADTDHAGKYLIGVVDALGSVPEADEANNTAVALIVR